MDPLVVVISALLCFVRTGSAPTSSVHRAAREPSGELPPKRVEPFPGRFACDRYAAARRNTSFSCSSSRIRFRASRSSVASVRVWPGLAPSSMSTRRIHFCSVIGWTPEVLRDLLEADTGLAVARHAHHIVTKLTRVRLGHSNTLPAHPHGQAN